MRIVVNRKYEQTQVMGDLNRYIPCTDLVSRVGYLCPEHISSNS